MPPFLGIVIALSLTYIKDAHLPFQYISPCQRGMATASVQQLKGGSSLRIKMHVPCIFLVATFQEQSFLEFNFRREI